MAKIVIKIKFKFKWMAGVVVPLLLGVCGVFPTRPNIQFLEVKI